MSDYTAWSSRARHNLATLLLANRLHNEAEDARKKELGKEFESEPFKIKLSVPNQELLDSSKELTVLGIDQDSMALYVFQVGGKADDLISILLGDVMLIGYCNRDLQVRLIEKLKK